MADPYADDVVLLLPLLGANNGTTFTDYSPTPKTVTAYGDAKTVTAQSKYYGSSGYFDGTGDYLTVPDGADWNFGAGEFTAEGWCYVSSLPGATVHLLGQFVGTAGTCSWHFGMISGGGVFFEVSTTGGYQAENSKLSGGGLVSADAWNHFALCRSANTFRLFVNGVIALSYTAALTLFDASTPLSVGATSAGQSLTGYLQDVRITKGVARYTANFTPPTQLIVPDPDPYVANVSLLLPLLGANNGTTFTDYSPTPKTVTGYGDAKTVTAQSKYYGSSAYFDGTGDSLRVVHDASLSMAAGDFTIELWYRPSTLSTPQNLVNKQASLASASGYLLRTTATGSLAFYGGDSSTTGAWEVAIDSGSLSVGTWHHLAITRSGSSWRLFLDGTQVGSTATASFTLHDASQSLFIGTNTDGSTYPANGYLQDLRITKGVARYTANFTPPTQLIDPDPDPDPDPDTSNVLLLPLSGANNGTTFTDYSPTPKIVTAYGNAKTVTAQSKYYGSSGYFDGTGDYLLPGTSSEFALGTGDFTLEFWVRTDSAAVQYNIIDFRPSNVNGAYPVIYQQATGNIAYHVSSAARIVGPAMSAGVWNHVAVSRASGTTKLFLNGVDAGTDYTDATDYLVGSNRPAIGVSGWSIGANTLAGHLQDIRITKGVARYTANFTPPAQLISIKVILEGDPLFGEAELLVEVPTQILGRCILPSAAGQFLILQAEKVLSTCLCSLPSATGAVAPSAEAVSIARVILPSAAGRVRVRTKALADEWGAAGFPLPRIEGYTYNRDMGLVRTPMDSGVTRQRRRWSNSTRTAQVAFEISTDLLNSIEEFINTKGFDWFGMYLVTEDNTTIRAQEHIVRIIADPAYGEIYGENIGIQLTIEIANKQ